MGAQTVPTIKRQTPAEHKAARGKIIEDVHIPPKRGDLVVHSQLIRDYVIGQGSTERQSVRIGIVTSVSRDGQIKRAWFPFSGESIDADAERAECADRMTGGALHYVSAEKVDIPAILGEYVKRRYPSAPHSQMILPFSDNADARALIVAHLTGGE